MSVKRCQQEIDSQEFAEWYADYCIEPWGEFRDDLRMALAMFQVFCMKGGKRLKVADFLLKFEKSKTQQTPAEARKIMLTAMRLAGISANGS
jgi:hypothetical protein